LGCLFCTPLGGLKRRAREEILRYEEILRLVRLLQGHFGLVKVHVTGGEPLARRGIVEFVGLLARDLPDRQAGRVEDLALTTNGQQLAAFAAELKQAGLGRINISLPSLNPRTFKKLTRGGDLERTLDGLDAALRADLAPVKCNMIVLRGVNDHEVADAGQAALQRGVQVRFIELMPIGPAAERHREWFVPSAETLDRLGRRFKMQVLPRREGSSAEEYSLTDATGNTGVVGLISSCTQPFCGDCNRLRLTADGRLVGCLAASGAEHLLPLLRSGRPEDEERIVEIVAAILRQKRARRGFSSGRCMVETGG
jgi:cyclic pyranopterin phosphate synthase